MRQKTNLRLILMFLLVLFLIGNTFNIFASEEPVLMDEEKHNTENTVIEDITEEVAETVSPEEAKDALTGVMKTETARAKESKGNVRAIVRNGTIGTVDWTLDDTGELVFGGGVFPDNYNWFLLGDIIKNNTKTVTFTAPVKAGKSLRSMFYRYTHLTNINGLEKLDTTNVTGMIQMFFGCSALTRLDLSNFETSSVTRMDDMFSYCSGLTSLDVSNFDTSKVTNMDRMFSYCTGLTSLDVSRFDTSKVIDMNRMFSTCSSLTSLDISNFDTSKVINMEMMFGVCSSLTSLDLSNFDTRNVTNIGHMFFRSISLTSLDLSKFDTSNVTKMWGLFGGCSSLTELDISGFDTSKVTEMGSMFFGCANLTNLDLTNFNTSNVTTMYSMFSHCTNLTRLDISSFDTSNVKNMDNMFSDCTNLTRLDISNFDTREATNMGWMFSNCISLEKLDISNFKTMNLRSMSGMFSNASIKEVSIGSDFRFEFADHLLAGPATNAEYTGHWEFVGSGETFAHTELLNYDGTKPGTYVWQRAAYNVTYDSKGGSPVAGETVEYNSAVTEPANPTKAGYIFEGWHKEEQYTNKWDFLLDVVQGNVILYAKWKAANYQIIYNLDGGINSSNNPSTYEVGVGVTSFEEPTKDGYKFLGWFESDTSNVEITNIGATEIGDKNLYARWEKIGATAKGGTVNKNNKRGTKTGDATNLLGLGAILLISGGYVINKKAKE